MNVRSRVLELGIYGCVLARVHVYDVLPEVSLLHLFGIRIVLACILRTHTYLLMRCSAPAGYAVRIY
jgi:hypothetical protein